MQLAKRITSTLATFTLTATVALAGDTYVVHEGPGAFTAIVTPDDSMQVNAADNVGTGASGSITPVTTGKHAGSLAFHGTLNGEPDPDPDGIGWGIVVKGDKPMLSTVAYVLTRLQEVGRILATLDEECDGVGSASSKVYDVATTLSELNLEIIPQLVAAKLVSEADAKKLKKRVSELLELAGELGAALNDLGSGDKSTVSELVKKLVPVHKKYLKLRKKLDSLLKEMKKLGLY